MKNKIPRAGPQVCAVDGGSSLGGDREDITADFHDVERVQKRFARVAKAITRRGCSGDGDSSKRWTTTVLAIADQSVGSELADREARSEWCGH